MFVSVAVSFQGIFCIISTYISPKLPWLCVARRSLQIELGHVGVTSQQFMVTYTNICKMVGEQRTAIAFLVSPNSKGTQQTGTSLRLYRDDIVIAVTSVYKY